MRAAGTACHLASNQDTHRARAMRELPTYRELFGRLWFSCDLGAAKPDTAFFDRILADLDVDPATLLFVDDKPENVAAAAAVGLRAETWSHEQGTARLRAILHGHGVALDPV